MRLALARVPVIAAIICVMAMSAHEASAQATASWPQRNVRLILPFGPGSGADIAARLLAEKLQPKWKQAIVMENRPGGDALLSMGAFASAKDDHVFYFGPTSTYIVHPYKHANLPYSPEDLQPIVRIAKTEMIFAVPSIMPVASLKDFVAHVNKHPGEMNFTTTPGYSEFVFDAFLKEQGLKMSRVPYRDVVQAPADLAENRLQAVMVAHAVALPMVRAGKIKILAVLDAARSPISPDVPSISEAGYPTLEAAAILGAYGPRGMPLELRERIAADVVEILKDEAIDERMRAAGNVTTPGGPTDLAKAVARQEEHVGRVAAILGMARMK